MPENIDPAALLELRRRIVRRAQRCWQCRDLWYACATCRCIALAAVAAALGAPE